MIKQFAFLILFFNKVTCRIHMFLKIPLFKNIGRNVIFNPNDSFSYHTIQIGNNVFIGSGAKFSGEIHIKDKVMFGPNVVIMNGNHDISQVGKYLIDIKENEKTTAIPLPVIIETDTWIGANVIILKGVIIGRGSIVGAGSVVTKNVAPYSVVAGNIAKYIKNRFEDDDIIRHELELNKLAKKI